MGEIENRWWESLNLDDCMTGIKVELGTMQRSFVSIGFYLRKIRDEELYKQDKDGEYGNIWEFAKDKFNLSMSSASRWMAINEKFSEDGNSPILAQRFKEYGKSQLQEMLTMSEDQLEQVTPDMTKMQIRDIKKGQPETERSTEADMEQIQGQDSILQHPEFMPAPSAEDNDPEEEKPTKEECIEEYIIRHVPPKFQKQLREGKNREFHSWMLDNKIIRYTDTPFGFMHGTNTHLVFEDKYKYILYKIPWFEVFRIITATGKKEGGADPREDTENDTLAELTKCIHQEGYVCALRECDKSIPGDGTDCTRKCCWNCTRHGECGYECNSSVKRTEAVEKVTGEVVDAVDQDENYMDLYKEPDPFESQPVHVLPEPENRNRYTRLTHHRENGIKTGYWSQDTKETLVERLAAYEDLELSPEQLREIIKNQSSVTGCKDVQPELPKFRNDDSRKAWLENYKDWGFWYRDDNLDINYYKYDFHDGTRLIAEEYPQREYEHTELGTKSDRCYYHLLRKNQKKYNRSGVYDKKYMHSGDSITYLVGFLKEIQK